VGVGWGLFNKGFEATSVTFILDKRKLKVLFLELHPVFLLLDVTIHYSESLSINPWV
jgi:hypothetical protein